MAASSESSLNSQEILGLAKARKKFSLGSDVDKEAVFDYSFLHDINTVSYIQEHGKVMFLIRGPPSTGKATLSEMFLEKYPSATHCCADHYFKNSFISHQRNRESLKASHVYCENKSKEACASNTSIVIIQNTHMRKWEMQFYIDLAAKYNYAVIMAVTLYRFDVTPEALLANNTDGLNITYFRKRLQQWVDIPPVLTGWFLGPRDCAHLQVSALSTVKELIGDGKFCTLFNIYSVDELLQYFQARKLLCCLAGYSADSDEMKTHYFSHVVQYLYGRCFQLTILGYHVTPTAINAIVDVDETMQLLIFGKDREDNREHLGSLLGSLEVSDNMDNYNATHSYENCEEPVTSTVTFEAWEEKDILTSKCTFINLACKKGHKFNVGNARSEFNRSLQEAADSNGCISDSSFSELDEGVQVCRVQENQWLVKGPEKIHLKVVFSGLYV